MTEEIDTSADLEKLDVVVESREVMTWKQVKMHTEKIIWQLEEDMKNIPESLRVNQAILELAENKLKELAQNAPA